MNSTNKRPKKPTRFQQRLINEIREHVRHAVPYSLTFKPTPGMSASAVKHLEEELRISFDLWADTWISPWIDRIENSMNGNPD
jgi:hypothetical protein